MNTYITLVGTLERIAKIRVSKFLLLSFLWRFKYRQKWIRCLLSFSSHFSSPVFQTLSNWARVLKFSVWVGTTVLNEVYSIFFNWLPYPSRGVITPIKIQSVPPIFKHFLFELECWIFLCTMGFYEFLKSSYPFPHPPLSPLNFPKVKFIIYCAIFIEFET